MPLAAKGLPFTLPLLEVVLVVAIPEDSVAEVELGVVDDMRDGGIGISKEPMGINTKELSSVSMSGRPESRARLLTVEGVIAPEKLAPWVVTVLLIEFLIKVDAEVEVVGMARCGYGGWRGTIVVAPTSRILNLRLSARCENKS